MTSFCKHEPHVVIDSIWAPRYSTNDVLININNLKRSVEHYLIKFTKAPSLPDWYYIDLKTLAACKTQKNGAGTMLVCPLAKLQTFTPLKTCNHEL